MRRRTTWTLKALRALLACLCVFFALPAASGGDPSLRPVAAAFASSAVATGAASETAEETAPERVVAAAVERPETLLAAAAPAHLPVRSGRHLYLEKRSLLR